jgi:hypothetical protein
MRRCSKEPAAASSLRLFVAGGDPLGTLPFFFSSGKSQNPRIFTVESYYTLPAVRRIGTVPDTNLGKSVP